MENKRHGSDELIRVRSKSEFKVKANDSGLFIEGFANKNVIDRGKERVSTDAWELENFMKNPIILFNHGLDPVFGGTPIGKAEVIEPTDKGLYIKVRLSNSKSPLISMIRDLVDEKILRAFSVGFDSKDEDYESDDETGNKTKVIKKAELFEVSVVGVPMNQDSIFEVSGKMLKTKSLDQIKELSCKNSGAELAARISHVLDEKKGAEPWFNRTEMIKSLCKMTALGYDDLMDMLSGFKQFSDLAVKAVSDALELDIEELLLLRERQASLYGDDGYLKTKEFIRETDEVAIEADTLEEKKKKAIQEKIEFYLDEGNSSEDAVAKAFAELEYEPVRTELTDYLTYADTVKAEKAEAASEEKVVEADEEKVADEEKTAAPEAEKAPDEEAEEKFVTEPTGKTEQETPSTAIKLEDDPNNFGSPFLEQSKQTNVLLGALIEEFRGLKRVLEGIQTLSNTETEEKAESEPVAIDEEKSVSEKAILDNYAKRLEDIRKRIENMN